MAIFVLIDTERLVFLKATKTIKQAEYWAELLAPTNNFLVTGLLPRDFSSLTHLELRMLYHHTTGEMPSQNIEYKKLVNGVSVLAKDLEDDDTSVEELESRLGKPLPPVDPKPAPEKAGRKPKADTSDKPVNRPAEGSTTRKVWDMADQLYKASGEVPTRGQVMEACEQDGINPSTASTQYGKWKKFINQQS